MGSVGLLAIGTGLFLMGLLDGESSLAEAALWVALMGSGNGLVQAAGFALAMRSVSTERFATAGSMLSLTQALGSIIAITVFGAVFAMRTDHHLAQFAGTVGAEAAAFLLAYRDVFMMAAGVAIVGALVALFGTPRHTVVQL